MYEFQMVFATLIIEKKKYEFSYSVNVNNLHY